MTRRSPAWFAAACVAVCILAAAPPPAGAGTPRCAPLFVRETEPAIPLIDGEGPVAHPWYGGWERPRPQLADVEGDGDFDLFLCEEDGQLRFYRNDGGASAPNFVFQTDDYGGVHELYFSRAADLDTDGDLDLIVEARPVEVIIDGFPVERPGAFLYWNEGTPANPIFVNRSTHSGKYWTDEDGTPITFFNSTPDFTDLDGDGDLDLLMGDGGNSGLIILYRNKGTPAAPSFDLETTAYQNIAIVFGSCIPTFAPPAADDRHGFMLFEFHDVDADGHEDLFVGDQFNSNCYFLSNQNTGGQTSPNFSCETDAIFPGEDGGPGMFSSYLLPALGDLDGDGDSDVLAGSGVVSDAAILHFENTGSPQSPSYTLRTTDYIPELDLGRASSPTLVDWDGDGALDIAVGVGSGQRVTYLHNTGTPAAPSFELEIPVLVALPNASWAAPEFADIDADGDLDLFAGTSNGAVRFWRNDAPPASTPAYVEILTDPAFGALPGKAVRDSVDEWSVPRFFDDDGDGDLDLLLGNWNFTGFASLVYFRNDGTPQAHSFRFVTRDYQGLGALGQNIAPELGDWDGDGDLDLLVGNEAGRIHCFVNTRFTGVPRFIHQTDFLADIDVGIGAVPALGDLDGDGDLDLIVGETGGGLNFYRNESEPGRFESSLCDVADGWDFRPPGPPETRDPGDPVDFAGGPDPSARGAEAAAELGLALPRVSPNPSRGPTTAAFTLPAAGRVVATIHDATGRRVAAVLDGERAAGSHELRWDGRDSSGERAAPGVYRLRLAFDGRTISRSFVVLRGPFPGGRRTRMQSEGERLARSLEEFEILESSPIEGGGRDALARVRSSGEEVRLWIGAASGSAPSATAPRDLVKRLQRVHQSSLPRVLEGFHDGARAVFVLQSYRGESLARRTAAAPPSVPDAIDVVKGIGAALAKAHAQGLVHGFVDESAVFLHEDGRPLLLYLGLGPHLAARPARAPEDLDGPRTATGDVFGLARVLARLVTGTDPYARGTTEEAVLALRMGFRSMAGELSPEIPEGLRRFLVRSIHPDPAVRIRRAEEFAGDLRVMRASWDTMAAPVQRALPFPPIRRVALTALAVGAAAAAVLLGRGCSRGGGFPG